MIRFGLLFCASFFLVACANAQTAPNGTAWHAPSFRDAQRACATMGYEPGTDQFQSCVLDLNATMQNDNMHLLNG